MFVVAADRVGGGVAVAASHRLDDNNPVVRDPACQSRSNSLPLGKDDDVTFSAKTRGRVDDWEVALATAQDRLPAFRAGFRMLSCKWQDPASSFR